MRDTVLKKLREVFLFLRYRIIWGMALGLLVCHVFAIAALFFISWDMVLQATVIWYVNGPLGTCVGFHRLLMHRSFEVRKPVEYAFTVFGMLGFANPRKWVENHTWHHWKADRQGDPHSPVEYSWFRAYVGWLFIRYPDSPEPSWGHKMPDNIQRLKSDRVHMFLSRWSFLPPAALGIGLYVWGGYVSVLTGFLAIVIGWHCMWILNWRGHSEQTVNPDTGDYSSDSMVAAALTLGEYHREHHRRPESARQGFGWKRPDPSWMVIRILQGLGIVWNPKLPDLG